MLRTVQDDIMTKIVKARDKETCQRCGSYLPKSRGLHNAHCFTRGRWNTRFDLENCDAVCYGCHRYWDKHKEEHKKWKIKQLGKKRFYALERRSNKPGKKTYLRSKEHTKELKLILAQFNRSSH